MKRYVMIAALLLVFTQCASAEEGPCIEILDMTGDVQAARGGGSFEAVAAGMLLEPGDSLRTGADSSADLSFDAEDSNVVKVGAAAHVVAVLEESEKIELINGDIYCTINGLPGGSSFEVKTPTAIAGVRGTDIRVEADAENTVVEAFDNSAFIRNKLADGTFSRAETIVSAGYMTNVRRHEPPSRPEPIPRQKIEQFARVKSDMMDRARQVRMQRKPPARMMRVPPILGQRRPEGPGPGDRAGVEARDEAGRQPAGGFGRMPKTAAAQRMPDMRQGPSRQPSAPDRPKAQTRPRPASSQPGPGRRK